MKCLICICKCYPFLSFPQTCSEIPHNYFCCLTAYFTIFWGAVAFHFPVTPTYYWHSCTGWWELPGRRVEVSLEVWSLSGHDLLCRQGWRVVYYTSMSVQTKSANHHFSFPSFTVRILLTKPWPANGHLSGWRYLPAGLASCCMCGLWLLRWSSQTVTSTKLRCSLGRLC